MFTLQTWVINIYILVSKSNHGFDPAGAMSGNAVVQLLHALHEAMPEYIFKPRARSTLACTALHRLQKHDHNMCCLRQALHQTHAPTTLSVNMHCSLRSVCVGGGGGRSVYVQLHAIECIFYSSLACYGTPGAKTWCCPMNTLKKIQHLLAVVHRGQFICQILHRQYLSDIKCQKGAVLCVSTVRKRPCYGGSI
jgi:hypothetical protein